MQYREVIVLFFNFKNKSNNFTDIKSDLFIKNPKYLYIFRYLFNKSENEYAKMFSMTSDELNNLIRQKKIDTQQADKFRDVIKVYLDNLEKMSLMPTDYLEVMSDNFIKEAGKGKIISLLKTDKIVNSSYYNVLMMVLIGFLYVELILIISPSDFPLKRILYSYTTLFLILVSIILLIVMFIYTRYRLSSAARLIFIADIIKNHLNKDDLKLMSFVKEYLLHISNRLYASRRRKQIAKEIQPVLNEINEIFFVFDDFVKNRLIHQLDNGNFSSVSLVVKKIGFQKMNGHLENYIYIKKILEEFKIKFEIQPYRKASKYAVAMQYSNTLVSSLINILLNIKSIVLEIIPYLIVALLLTYVYYVITNDLTNSAVIFTGLCALLAVVYNKRK